MKKLFIFLMLLTAIPMMAQNTTEYEVKLKNKMHMNGRHLPRTLLAS